MLNNQTTRQLNKLQNNKNKRKIDLWIFWNLQKKDIHAEIF